MGRSSWHTLTLSPKTLGLRQLGTSSRKLPLTLVLIFNFHKLVHKVTRTFVRSSSWAFCCMLLLLNVDTSLIMFFVFFVICAVSWLWSLLPMWMRPAWEPWLDTKTRFVLILVLPYTIPLKLLSPTWTYWCLLSKWREHHVCQQPGRDDSY